MNWRKITYHCSFDDSMQHAMFRAASGAEARPLLVALHTWSGDYTQNCDVYGNYCAANNWTFIHPDFRGPNWLPEGCGSEAMVQDIVDAVAFAVGAAEVDPKRVYLIGGSGGGHASLLLAGRHPELWTAVSSWCPISDVGAWHEQSVRLGSIYAGHIEKACGGNPQTDERVRAEAWKRSPLCHMQGASRVVLDIATGIHDGHTGSVPVSQAIHAFNALAAPEDQLSDDEINYIVEHEKIPASFAVPEEDPAFGTEHKVLFRRRSNIVRLTLFEGGHDLLGMTGLTWLARQARDKAPDWTAGPAGDSGAFELAK